MVLGNGRHQGQSEGESSMKEKFSRSAFINLWYVDSPGGKTLQCYSVHFYPTIQPANLSVVEEVFLFAGLKSVFTTVFIQGGENTKTACVWCDCGHERKLCSTDVWSDKSEAWLMCLKDWSEQFSVSLVVVQSACSFQWRRFGQKERILNCQRKLAVERVMRHVCAFWLANCICHSVTR